MQIESEEQIDISQHSWLIVKMTSLLDDMPNRSYLTSITNEDITITVLKDKKGSYWWQGKVKGGRLSRPMRIK